MGSENLHAVIRNAPVTPFANRWGLDAEYAGYCRRAAESVNHGGMGVQLFGLFWGHSAAS